MKRGWGVGKTRLSVFSRHGLTDFIPQNSLGVCLLVCLFKIQTHKVPLKPNKSELLVQGLKTNILFQNLLL